MKIQLKTEVKGIELELSVGEALMFLKDPSRVQSEVRSMLKVGNVDVPGNPGKKSEMITCPDCGKLVKKRGLGVHQARGCPGRLNDGD